MYVRAVAKGRTSSAFVENGQSPPPRRRPRLDKGHRCPLPISQRPRQRPEDKCSCCESTASEDRLRRITPSAAWLRCPSPSPSRSAPPICYSAGDSAAQPISLSCRRRLPRHRAQNSSLPRSSSIAPPRLARGHLREKKGANREKRRERKKEVSSIQRVDEFPQT